MDNFEVIGFKDSQSEVFAPYLSLTEVARSDNIRRVADDEIACHNTVVTNWVPIPICSSSDYTNAYSLDDNVVLAAFDIVQAKFVPPHSSNESCENKLVIDDVRDDASIVKLLS